MPKFVDRTGFRYGRLTAMEKAGRNNHKKVLWRCLCDCGVETFVDSGSLVSGNTTSCGCVLKEKITKHGGSGTGSYNTWRGMIRRCTNPNDKDYARYGGAGINVHPDWLSYEAFRRDMGEPPTDDHSLDRRDPYGGYTPENCWWATATDQARNIRGFGRVRGVRRVGSRWYAVIGVNHGRVRSRSLDTLEQAMAERKRLEKELWGRD